MHQVKAKAARKISYSEFLTALPLISDKKARAVLKVELCRMSYFWANTLASTRARAHVLCHRRKSLLMSSRQR